MTHGDSMSLMEDEETTLKECECESRGRLILMEDAKTNAECIYFIMGDNL